MIPSANYGCVVLKCLKLINEALITCGPLTKAVNLKTPAESVDAPSPLSLKAMLTPAIGRAFLSFAVVVSVSVCVVDVQNKEETKLIEPFS